VDYAVENGITTKSEFPNVNTVATRGEMAHIFANAVPKSELTAINNINAVPDITAGDGYTKDILLLYRAGVLTGDSNTHNFRSGDHISRAEVATIIVRMALPAERKSFAMN
jgi:hypothetical protein